MSNQLKFSPKSVLFCCDYNDIRSPIAEGIANKFYGDHIHFRSTGAIDAHSIDSLAVSVCKEIDVELSGHRSHSIDDYNDFGESLSEFDLIVTMTPASQRAMLEQTRNYHLDVDYWPVMDPKGIGNNNDAILDTYRSVRDHIAQFLSDRFGPPVLDGSFSADNLKHDGSGNIELETHISEVLDRAADLEAYIQPVVSNESMIGHNGPPEGDRIDEPFTKSDWLELQNAIVDIRASVKADVVSESHLEQPTVVIESKIQKLLGWISGRFTKVVDASLVAVGTTFGASIVIDPNKLLTLSKSLLTSVQNLLTSLPMP